MCNLYSLNKGQAAIVALVRAMRDRTGNLPALRWNFSRYHPAADQGGTAGRAFAGFQQWRAGDMQRWTALVAHRSPTYET